MAEKRLGQQYPTESVILPYTITNGGGAIDLYNETSRTAQEWQVNLINHILAVDDDGLYVHTKVGYSVPRRNGKNEVVTMRELYALEIGERTLHTAHRTTTSSSAAKRLANLLDERGYTEVIRVKKGETYDKHYVYAKQFGLERITLLCDGGGSVDFRTRSSHGGLGEGFDLLIIDEAQEYTSDQESALKYVVSDSANPQTLFCGTPPTAVSVGDVFPKMRKKALSGDLSNTMWAEWSVTQMSSCTDKELWYRTNPSLGTILTERKIQDEVGDDEADFNIQRLGLWIESNLKSAISPVEWGELLDENPSIDGNVSIGVKFGQDGTNVALSLAVKTTDGKIYVEAIDCKPIREGNTWLIAFIQKCKKCQSIAIDGQNGQKILHDALAELGIKSILPTVREVVVANSMFEQAIFGKTMCHSGQPSLDQIVTNCEHRAIGTNGGFGYKSIKLDADVALMDSAILAHWLCSSAKEPKKQQARY